jgi:hypothetical protein
VRFASGIVGPLLAASLLAGCAGDPHPASSDTPGDPWHPPSAQSDPAAPTNPVQPPQTVTGDLDTTHKPQVP